MALAAELIEQTIRHRPDDYTTWQKTAEFILLTSGNGYYWNDEGEVEYVSDLTPWEAENERQMLLALPEKIRQAMMPTVKARVVKNKKLLHNLPTVLNDVESLTDKVFVDPYCLLATAPANVSDDWAGVIYELTKDAELVFED